MRERQVLKSFQQWQKAENGLGCDVVGFYWFLGVLRENQREFLEFGLELGGFWGDYGIFGCGKSSGG